MAHVGLSTSHWDIDANVHESHLDGPNELAITVRADDGSVFEFIGGFCRKFTQGRDPSKGVIRMSKALMGASDE